MFPPGNKGQGQELSNFDPCILRIQGREYEAYIRKSTIPGVVEPQSEGSATTMLGADTTALDVRVRDDNATVAASGEVQMKAGESRKKRKADGENFDAELRKRTKETTIAERAVLGSGTNSPKVSAVGSPSMPTFPTRASTAVKERKKKPNPHTIFEASVEPQKLPTDKTEHQSRISRLIEKTTLSPLKKLKSETESKKPQDASSGAPGERKLLLLGSQDLKTGQLSAVDQLGNKRMAWRVFQFGAGPKGVVHFPSNKAGLIGPFAFLNRYARCSITTLDTVGTGPDASIDEILELSKARLMFLCRRKLMTVESARKMSLEDLRFHLGRDGTSSTSEDRQRLLSVSPEVVMSPTCRIEFEKIWEEIVFDVMYLAVKAKFDENPDWAIKLLMTGGFSLVETHVMLLDSSTKSGSSSQDAPSTMDGTPHILGEVMEIVRDELREDEKYKHLPQVYHLHFWDEWERALLDDSNTLLEINDTINEIAEETDKGLQENKRVLVEVWGNIRQKRKERAYEEMRLLQRNFERSVVPAEEDLTDPKTYRRWVEKLGKLPEKVNVHAKSRAPEQGVSSCVQRSIGVTEPDSTTSGVVLQAENASTHKERPDTPTQPEKDAPSQPEHANGARPIHISTGSSASASGSNIALGAARMNLAEMLENSVILTEQQAKDLNLEEADTAVLMAVKDGAGGVRCFKLK